MDEVENSDKEAEEEKTDKPSAERDDAGNSGKDSEDEKEDAEDGLPK